MAKNKQKKKHTETPQAKAVKPGSRTVLERLELWFEAHNRKLFTASCLLTVLFSILHFNVRISEGGDDSTYIHAGHKYASDFFNYFFTYNAPLYPMFLSLPI